ncbi:MAG: Hpt domain-containing protein [Cyanophyceae cyanobacterium]
MTSGSFSLEALLAQLPPPLFDPEPLQQCVETLEEEQGIATLSQLVELYLKDAPTYRDQVFQGIAEENDSLLRQAAHTLKSSSRSLGAVGLGKVCEAMEKNAIAKRFAIASLQKGKFAKTFDESIKILTQFSGNLRQ